MVEPILQAKDLSKVQFMFDWVKNSTVLHISKPAVSGGTFSIHFSHSFLHFKIINSLIITREHKTQNIGI